MVRFIMAKAYTHYDSIGTNVPKCWKINQISSMSVWLWKVRLSLTCANVNSKSSLNAADTLAPVYALALIKCESNSSNFLMIDCLSRVEDTIWEDMTCLKEHSASMALPFPTVPPSTFAAGTLTSLKVTVAVSNPFIPSFSGPFCKLTPVVDFSIKAQRCADMVNRS